MVWLGSLFSLLVVASKYYFYGSNDNDEKGLLGLDEILSSLQSSFQLNKSVSINVMNKFNIAQLRQ